MINILVKIGLSQDNFRMLFCSETIQNFFANNARVHITLFTNLLQILINEIGTVLWLMLRYKIVSIYRYVQCCVKKIKI